MTKRRVAKRPRRENAAENGEKKPEIWSELVKTNAKFESYYRSQLQFETEEEWELFLSHLRQELPASFRITGSRDTALDFKQNLLENFFDSLRGIVEVDGQSIRPPQTIPFYPNGLAFQFEATRRQIRNSAALKEFHKILISENEIGNITRQETVSMIPPLFLDVQPNHFILDMCAAPGSKTSQIVDMMHSGLMSHEIPSGLLVANDIDTKRAYMLVHQMQRLASPCLMVTNYDSSLFPKIPRNNDGDLLLFDRILADVPCSGDGTLRKNFEIWKKWSPRDGNSLHPLQVRILTKAVELLKVGGRIVYSTCSLNPIENEAVVGEILTKFPSMRLVDVSSMYEDLKRAQGMSTWKVCQKDGSVVESAPVEKQQGIQKSMFPPENEDIKIELKKCIRIYPHLQNTGGFFVAVLEKSSETESQNHLSEENNIAADEKAVVIDEDDTSSTDAVPTGKNDKRKKSDKLPDRFVNEEPFILLQKDSEEITSAREMFGLDQFPLDQFLVRSEGKNRNVYFISKAIKSCLEVPENSNLKLINTGIKAFGRNTITGQDGGKKLAALRLHAEILPFIIPYMNDKRVIDVQLSDLKVALTTEFPFFTSFTDSVKVKLESIQFGGFVFKLSFSSRDYYFPLWRAKTSVNLLLDASEKESWSRRLFPVVETNVVETVEKQNHDVTAE